MINHYVGLNVLAKQCEQYRLAVGLALIICLLGCGGGVGSSSPSPNPTNSPGSSASQAEERLAQLIIQDPNQKRPSMKRNSILAKVARQRAEDMARRNYFSHTNPDGFGPNYLVKQAGYVLPDHYDQSPSGNNIESIAAGSATAEETKEMWLNSQGHRTHMLGEIDFYAEQIEYGIGYANVPGSDYRYYWVLLTAKPGP